jgi:hypothetical protein
MLEVAVLASCPGSSSFGVSWRSLSIERLGIQPSFSAVLPANECPADTLKKHAVLSGPIRRVVGADRVRCADGSGPHASYGGLYNKLLYNSKLVCQGLSIFHFLELRECLVHPRQQGYQLLDRRSVSVLERLDRHRI